MECKGKIESFPLAQKELIDLLRCQANGFVLGIFLPMESGMIAFQLGKLLVFVADVTNALDAF